jgi:cysteine desulfurase
MRRVFLDHQSTTPLLPAVAAAMEPFWRDTFGNPSSLHREGLRARHALARAREQFAALIHAAAPEEILFTSSGTEAANLAIQGVARANARRGNHLVVTATEHPAVLRSVELLEQQGCTVTRIPVDALGRVSPAAVGEAITDQTILICVHHTNHDIGTLEPVAAIGQLAAEHGIPLFVDATASGGWVPIDVQSMSIDLLSLSPHRFYGPKGVGGLYRRRRIGLAPLVVGGQQENGLRAGTENVPAIVGAGVAAELAAAELTVRGSKTAALQRRLWEGIQRRVSHVRLNGPMPGPERYPSNLHCCIEFVEGEPLVLALDVRGVAAHSGPSCVARSAQIPPVLRAIGLPSALARSGVLFSPGYENTEDEMDHAVDTLAKVVDRLRAMSASWEDYQQGRIDSVVSPRAAHST